MWSQQYGQDAENKIVMNSKNEKIQIYSGKLTILFILNRKKGRNSQILEERKEQ